MAMLLTWFSQQNTARSGKYNFDLFMILFL